MKYSFESAFSRHIIGLIQQKRADGFLYEAEEYVLKKFDEFCISNFPADNVITQDIVARWSAIRPTEGNSTRRRRASVIRQLCLYARSLGLESYVPHNLGKADKPVLYIPSKEEMEHFFSVLDSWEKGLCYGLHFLGKYQIMFRLYYCCGLRLSEACSLKREHVNLSGGTLTILHSKGQKDRLVHLPADGMEMVAEYLERLERELPDDTWLFPGDVRGKHISTATVWRTFRKCWNKLPFSNNTDKRPSVHCLRHSFVVERINDWMRHGVDLQNMLPHLSAYLGHSSPSETFYYYHIVNKAFDIIRQKDKVSKRVIPEVISYEEI